MERNSFAVDTHTCWNCHHTVDSGDKCPTCHKILPMVEDVDYFSFLGFKKQLNLDLDELEHRFYELSREYHPDYYSNGSEIEKEISLERASFLNSAYQILKDPIQRAKYLLQLEWGEVPEEKKKIPPEILMEVMELQEKLVECNSETDPEKKKKCEAEIEQIKSGLLKKMVDLNAQLKNLFIKWDENVLNNPSNESKQEILKELNKNLSIRAYLNTLLSTINK